MINLEDYGYIETETIPAGFMPGRITELQRERYSVITERGEVTATLKGSFLHEAELREDLPCVGDFVLLRHNKDGDSQVAGLLPRRAKFSRVDFLGHAVGYVKTAYEQLVAANFDYVFILSSLNNDFNVKRIIRYLTQARQSGAMPVVILTKADLAEDCGKMIEEAMAAVKDTPVHAISSHTGAGMGALDAYLKPGKTIVFLGMSGVGKSSLLNALMQKEVMAVKAIREDDSRGRHTTTHRQLFMLPSGAMVIDTPGMRELGLYHADEGISAVFSDIEELFSMCKFSNCRHKTEPGCAVLAAIAGGSLPKKRWESYLAQKRETKLVDDKTAYLREKREQGKSIAKFTRQFKKKEIGGRR